jgi:2-phosphosulfolactate phosphatase
VTAPEHGQASYARRLDWGPSGAAALVADARPGDVAVVVDVLSFTTTLCVLATGRRAGLASGAVSLSPVSFLGVSGVERVVLPSPNGSAISLGLADAGVTVVGACLRNAPAVGRWLRDRPGRVSVVAAGERWPNRSLRPAVEDLWGAGAVLAVLGPDSVSPEAAAAVAAFAAVRDRLPEALAACASGRELEAGGFAADIDVAAAYDVTGVVPVLQGDAFVAAPGQGGWT